MLLKGIFPATLKLQGTSPMMVYTMGKTIRSIIVSHKYNMLLPPRAFT
jgi:hypothetical protein